MQKVRLAKGVCHIGALGGRRPERPDDHPLGQTIRRGGGTAGLLATPTRQVPALGAPRLTGRMTRLSAPTIRPVGVRMAGLGAARPTERLTGLAGRLARPAGRVAGLGGRVAGLG
ncbi:hypothetical protein ODJ79_39985, partial [Actinoplanes sp. KI2]|uniref:hypothetical protein n=1 Tax=Actinoplanes sp. KI2 TaxID=2983315 RepID=UPI0021D5C1E8